MKSACAFPGRLLGLIYSSFVFFHSIAIASTGLGSDQVVIYPAPAGAVVSKEYQIEVNGRPLDVYAATTLHHDKKYYFASFDFSGAVEVRVKATRSVEKVAILPESSGLKPTLQGAETLVFTARQPFKISIEPDGLNSPLLLFGNALEQNVPDKHDPHIVYFGPGVHRPGKISLKSNQTLYLAGGAVVKGGVEAEGENIRILGRGILDGSDYPHFKGPTQYMVQLMNCKNVLVKDVILQGSWLFTMTALGSSHVTIDNLKICGSRVVNDDAFAIINSSDVTIRDCFARSDDDSVSIKGILGFARKSVERIRIENTTFWTDRANIFRIGFECEADSMNDIGARNIDVIHFAGGRTLMGNSVSVWFLQPSDNMPMSGIHFEDFRINANGNNNFLVRITPMVTKGLKGLDAPEWKEGRFPTWDYRQAGRYVKDCSFKNITLAGKAGGGPGIIYVAGVNADRVVENISFENFNRFGEPTTERSPNVLIDLHTRNIQFSH